MNNNNSNALEQFNNLVGIKFQLYNSLFTSLPFHTIEKTGILVSLLLMNCEDGFKKRESPIAIIDNFIAKQTSFNKEEQKIDLLFRFVQYIERQVVLFDALEDAAFKFINDFNGTGTLKHLSNNINSKQIDKGLQKKLNAFKVQLVLTAHPTQFYRGAVLGIINDISNAVQHNQENLIYTYLQQLGRTPFYQKNKPTPFDEAVSLIWYLENVFYPATARIKGFIKNNFNEVWNAENTMIKMGFWPGGDRDGNPFVNVKTTQQVANALRSSIIKCYYLDIRKLKRRLTFKGVDITLAQLEKKLYDFLFIPNSNLELNKEDILQELQNIKEQLIYNHSSLFVQQVDALINKVEVFGLHFASIDIRQESSVHTKTIQLINQQYSILPQQYESLNESEKINLLLQQQPIHIDKNLFAGTIYQDTIAVIAAIKNIQKENGEQGCNRYIISQCNSALNVIEVYSLFLLTGWKAEQLTIDIIPLFETIDDLKNAATIMETLYSNLLYKAHLSKRGNQQTIMLGFSDGTKDGGYLMANWSIYTAKEQLTAISKKYDIDVVFFDGRGGPPARGGGKTHNFYASMGNTISNKEIQLTIQGQTISSNFGTIDAAQYNIEQLLHAGLSNTINTSTSNLLSDTNKQIIQTLANKAYEAYNTLKNHPYFTEYLMHASPLKFYAETNIGSRPSKRGASNKLSLAELRAIPFVGAWSQLKQNVTGFYGVGIALEFASNNGNWNHIKQLYQQSLFFRTLIDNCEMAMKKSFFPLTAYLSHHSTYGEIWNLLYEEFERTKKYIFLLTEQQELMANYPIDKLSIEMREKIVLPLLTIQQYALNKIREFELNNHPNKKIYEKLVMRTSFGIINAGRNSA